MDFGGLPNTLYRNNGDGTFSDVTASTGVLDDASRKSMQVVFNVFNEDRLPDLFVTNEQTPMVFILIEVTEHLSLSLALVGLVPLTVVGG
ncbi:MAG: hypothetical protein CM1200mP10_33540 [Candidatus Neomarinimicrobiota bacterium]|nr:MAG: hypothetical protein CM1200mP10_33540 [Candidatus Neomarinimicrobiota bacterium]